MTAPVVSLSDDEQAIALTQLGIVSPPFITADQANVGRRAARARARAGGRMSVAEMERRQRRRVGREAAGRRPGDAEINRERYEMVAIVMVADVAQQGVAPEPPKRSSHGDL